ADVIKGGLSRHQAAAQFGLGIRRGPNLGDPPLKQGEGARLVDKNGANPGFDFGSGQNKNGDHKDAKFDSRASTPSVVVRRQNGGGAGVRFASGAENPGNIRQFESGRRNCAR
ncbi:MAG: hypothetical protein ACXWC8_19250, partial [Limisphaerales bacterium]